MNTIYIKNLTKQYEGTPVLNQLNLEIKEGKITCIMGPSGIGKTTLINILMGLVKADSGVVDGLDGKKFAAVFQENRLCEEIGAILNVKMVCDKKVTESRIKKELESVGLIDYEKKKVNELSGGMKRRVAIVRAVMANSDIIIMDEPFKGLDDKLKIQVINYIKQKTGGKTLIVITHNKEEVEAFSADLIELGNNHKEY
ncbi:ATP-binding cassette domain-containing protein [Anaerocolumna sedimenticola]|uniref:ATP-binding cassette domain-containing protein n=1 Tax=Anaerocolumna sedimenticola TaxID=2696063 RepID=A0A6P1TJV3_9FIRM|nr:ATP-binding cassette domain-containing protein [Anaerocolumna sedimenticola]QHQ60382.1 ATP-binding cassette domain-containing protein [Anaerocolumna sedimenticola]